MKQFCVLIIILTALQGIVAQSAVYTYPDFSNQPVENVLNHPDWLILQCVSGNLDRDGHSDLVILLEKKSKPVQNLQSYQDRPSQPRILIITKRVDSKHKVAIQNNTMIPLAQDGGMLPYLEPEISVASSGKLIIDYELTRGRCTYMYELFEGCIALVKVKKFTHESVSRSFENTLIDFKEQIIVVENGNMSNEESQVKAIKLNHLTRCISEMVAPFEWEVLPDIWI